MNLKYNQYYNNYRHRMNHHNSHCNSQNKNRCQQHTQHLYYNLIYVIAIGMLWNIQYHTSFIKSAIAFSISPTSSRIRSRRGGSTVIHRTRNEQQQIISRLLLRGFTQTRRKHQGISSLSFAPNHQSTTTNSKLRSKLTTIQSLLSSPSSSSSRPMPLSLSMKEESSSSTTTTTLPMNSFHTTTNQEIAERKLQLYHQKKVEKIQSLQEKRQRQLQWKTSFSSKDNSNNLISIKVNVCNELRNELKLSGREKRGRLFIEVNSNPTKYIKSLKGEIHAFFSALKKDTYIIQASLITNHNHNNENEHINNHDNNHIESTSPSFDGTVSNSNDNNNEEKRWTIENDEDVTEMFQRSLDYFHMIQQQQQNQQQSQSLNGSDENKNENDDQHNNMNHSTTTLFKRPSIMLHVVKNPNGPDNISSSLPIPSYLLNMSNPNDNNTTITMLSFYSFGYINNPDEFSIQLKKLWEPFHVLGRVYIANEGINAQMSCPTNVLLNFINCCEYYLPNENISLYLRTKGNSVNIDPIPLTRDEYAVAGSSATSGKPSPPFTNLHIRVRQQIVSDGLYKSYNWDQAGYDMPPLEWHAKLENARRLREEQNEKEDDDNTNIPIILDCRNTYETDVGIFDGAIPLQTNTFKDTWDSVKEQLKDKPKDAPIMMYCTGGIRCVKVGAYVTQELGYTNVSRLAGGIIAYDRAIAKEQQQQQEEKVNEVENTSVRDVETKILIKDEIGQLKGNTIESLFKGTNFVFDGRLGRKITDDALGKCLTCGNNTTLVSNCRNDNCHKRMIQCENCRTSLLGTCSDACYHLVSKYQQQQTTNVITNRYGLVDDDIDQEEQQQQSVEKKDTHTIYATIDSYSNGHSSPVPNIYPEMEYNTKALIPSGSHMLSGPSQGRLLKQLASMTREGRILELGTFAGYATAWLWEGSMEAGRVISSGENDIGTRSRGPYVMSMERDAKAFDVAVKHLRIISQYGFHGDDATEAMCSLRQKDSPSSEPSIVIEDNMSITFPSYDNVATCEIVKVSDALATIEQMAVGRGHFMNSDNDDAVAPFDMIFLDADKTRLSEYVEAFLSSDRILKKGGLIVVDNVLWKGLVLEANNGFDISSRNSNSQLPKDHVENQNLSTETGIHSNSDNNSNNNNIHHYDSDDDESTTESMTELRKNRRARKLANKMHRFNSKVVQDPRLEVLVLPMRDGLSIIRKK